jgi:CRISPR-associated endonuclease Cas2
MSRPKKVDWNLKEKLERIHSAGLNIPKESRNEEGEIADLDERIQAILGIFKSKPLKSTEMNYLIMYDISDNKVRTQIANFLIREGCIRIQKSVYLVRSENKKFDEIYAALSEVNSYYENADSIILVPLNATDARSMKLIGKNVNIQAIVDKPNTLFF